MAGAVVFQAERLNRITKLLQANGYADINDLAALFSVSTVTIRRDLDLLVKRGQAIRAHGGVLMAEPQPTQDEPYQTRTNKMVAEKQFIGREAAKLIKDGDVIFLDAGTTTLEVARNIQAEDVTVITNDLYIAMNIAYSHKAKLIVVGGELIKGVFTLSGDSTAELIRKLHVNKAYMGCDAIHLQFGVSNRVLTEVPIKLAITAAADEVVLVTDSTKLHQKALYSLFPLTKISTVVIDHCDDAFKEAFAQAGVQLIEQKK